RFTSDPAAITGGNSDVSWSTKATYAGGTVREGDVPRLIGKRSPQQSLDGFRRRRAWKFDKFVPKLCWFTFRIHCHFAQTGMAFFENERFAARLQRFRIALEHGCSSLALIERQCVFPFREDGTRDESNQINRIGHPGNIIKIIDAPAQSTFDI